MGAKEDIDRLAAELKVYQDKYYKEGVSLVSDSELSPEYILPMAFDERVGPSVAAAVAKAARESGTARI